MSSFLVIVLAVTLFVRPFHQLLVRINPLVVVPSGTNNVTTGISTRSKEKIDASSTTRSTFVVKSSSKLTNIGTKIRGETSSSSTTATMATTSFARNGNAFTSSSSSSSSRKTGDEKSSTTRSTLRGKSNTKTESATIRSTVTGKPMTVATPKFEPKRQPIKVDPLIDNANVTSYCGHFIVEKQGRLFYWFVMSENNSSKAPVVVWLQGQPDASSLYGAFDENGLYLVDSINNEPKIRSSAWTTVYNVLYLDHYPDCGFSYWSTPSKKYPHMLRTIAKNLYVALQQFYALFPQFSSNDLYIAAESVGARYAIKLAHAIHQRLPPDNKIPLKGLFVGNGLFEGCQLKNHGYLLHLFGIIDLRTRNELERLEEKIGATLRASKYEKATKMWHEHVVRILDDRGYGSLYDARDTNAFWNSRVRTLFERETIKAKYKMSNRVFKPAAIKKYFDADDLTPFYPTLREVLSYTKMVFFNGQYDMFASCIHGTMYWTALTWPITNESFVLYPKTDPTKNERLLGYKQTYGNFTLVNVLHAGHNIGVSRPKAMFQLLNDYINDIFF